jgi:hypothetical protein
VRKLFARRPSPAMIVALVALCLGAGGTAIAAKVKLGKNVVKTKNIKNNAITKAKIGKGAVTEPKIAAGAVTAAKLAGSAKSTWVELDTAGAAIDRQSGGVTLDEVSEGQYVVNFGTSIDGRGVTVTPMVTLADINAQWGRCTEVDCPGAAGSNSSILVFTINSGSGMLDSSGFSAAVLP